MPQELILQSDLRQGVAGSRYIPNVACHKVTAVASECKASFPIVFLSSASCHRWLTCGS